MPFTPDSIMVGTSGQQGRARRAVVGERAHPAAT